MTMSIEQCIAKVRTHVAERREQFISNLEIMLIDYGATDDERRDVLVGQLAEFDAGVERQLKDLEAWLKRGGEPLHG